MTVIKFNFVIKNAHTKPGENVHLVGSLPQLGSWKDTGSMLLKTSPEAYPCWRTTEAFSITTNPSTRNESILETNIEYKYLIKNKVRFPFVLIFLASVQSLLLGEKHSQSNHRRAEG